MGMVALWQTSMSNRPVWGDPHPVESTGSSSWREHWQLLAGSLSCSLSFL